MTAVIGILNKHGVAIAADSAVTISGPNGRKILNSANKIFTLSKYHPIGVMIYNSADFMTTPWELIIKSYRRDLGETEYNTVSEYLQSFITYLKSKNYYTDSDFQKQTLGEMFQSILNGIFETALRGVSFLESTDPKEITKLLKVEVDRLHEQLSGDYECCEDFKDYSFEDFDAYSMDVFEATISQPLAEANVRVPNAYLLKLKEILFEYIRSKQFSSFTGLIFVGYGRNEIYPSLVPLDISGVLDNRLRYFVDESKSANITNTNYSAIRPFAQTDVINTILSGIDPDLDNLYINQLHDFFVKYNKEVADVVRKTDKGLADQIQNLDISGAFASEYANSMQQVRKTKYVEPLMNAVASLSKEDLSEMAESLIYLTYLKRRITFAEESVGGPVDVALISRGDGFIWIKRKHYFKPELNHHFFANYINPRII